jgi:hypothetical protein
MSQLRKIRYRLFSWWWFPDLEPSKEPIDVVIPIIAKDLHILPLCLEGVRKCVAHPIQEIYIVAPAQQEILDFCKEHRLQFVDETTIFGFSPKELDIQYISEKGEVRDRSGWLFQQLVKLSGKVGTCQHYLCIDADHVLIHPHVFLTKENKTVFYMSYEEHQPYYDNIHRLIPDLPLDTLSYVDHKMLFDKEQLEVLHQTLGGEEWVKTILENYDRHSHAGFSEFELYGNFVKEKVRRPWLQKTLRYKKLADYETLCRQWKGSRWSVTFPDYMNK